MYHSEHTQSSGYSGPQVRQLRPAHQVLFLWVGHSGKRFTAEVVHQLDGAEKFGAAAEVERVVADGEGRHAVADAPDLVDHRLEVVQPSLAMKCSSETY